MTESDNKWSVLAAAAHAASAVIGSVMDAKRHPNPDPSLHERVALLEKRVEDLEKGK